MAKKVILTGASGFVGHFMLEALLARGFEVYALDKGLTGGFPESVIGLDMDLCDPKSLKPLSLEKWWGIVHLAAISVPSLFNSPAPVISNLQMTLNLLESVQGCRILLVSSCHVYAPSTIPRKEDHPIIPQGRYGLSKHLCEQLASHFKSKMDVRIARPFNHIGIGMRPELMIPSLMRRLREDAPLDSQPLVMQGINSIRDFIDVRDVVQGYLAILDLENPVDNTFNVCTGIGNSIEDLVRMALGLLGSHRSVEFENNRVSQDDIPFLVGDPSRLSLASGWTPKWSLSDSLNSILNNRSL